MSIPICKFFKSEQGCKFGNKCRYKHSDPLTLPDSSLNYENQNYGSVRGSPFSEISFAQGNFATSSNHEASVKNPRTVNSGYTTNPSYVYQPRNNEESVRFTSSQSSAEVDLEKQFQKLETTDHNEGAVGGSTVSQQLPRKVCHFFARNGNCCFGSRCRFEHDRSNRLPPRFQQERGESRSWVAGNRDQPPSSQDSKTENEGVRSSRYSRNNNGSYSADKPSTSFRNVPAAVAYQGRPQNDTTPGPSTDSGSSQEGAENKINERNQNMKFDKICQFYVRGWCFKGRKCRFLHPRRQGPLPSKNVSNEDQQLSGAKAEEESSSLPHSEAKGSNTPTPAEEKSAEPASKQLAARNPRPTYVARGTRKFVRKEVDDVEGTRLRRTEIDQLIKRFPKSKVKVHRDCAEFFQCVVSFSPTDPDWPYDVKVFQLQVDIPSDYPFEMMTITLPEEQELPETVRRYLEVSIEEWLEDKERLLEDNGQLELVFRPFLRWLDRNIEDVVTEGLKQMKRELVAKAAGLEFVSAKELQKQYPGQTAKDGDDHNDNSDDDENESGSQDEDTSSEYDESDEDEESGDERPEEDDSDAKKSRRSQQDKVKIMMADPERKGTEITLKNMQLKENAATLYFEKICLLIQCERCKATSEFMASCGRTNMVQCGQCNQTQVATYRPAMVHHFSSVIGYLDLDACLPFDVILQNCSPVIACLHCSKDTKPGSVIPGQPQDHWCRVCHHKLRVATDGVRFTQLEPSKVSQCLKGLVKVVVPNCRKLPKDPAIQEGKPLPNFGTCKHYKKSYRWLRFPCCGKCYPCDVCHDSKEDHEMKFANRMICGFCCKEQMYAPDKACKGCDMNMTKVHTKHWEGGQGCRDKITMNRNDKHKHKNMNKTVSKHSQKVKDMQSKKRTKLRHT